MKIIIEIDIFFGEIALIGLIDEDANGIEVESRRGEERSRPELNERRMLWVDTKIGVAHVGDACGSESNLVSAIKNAAQVDEAVNNLAERFEEMCRRQKISVNPELRPSVVKLLAAELWVNHQALGIPAEELIGVTVQQGAVGPELQSEFDRFRDRPGVFTTAAIGYPSDPRSFLRKVAKNFDTLA